jgi:UDP-N-acetylmuramoylalanine--D-glutamate ligase
VQAGRLYYRGKFLLKVEDLPLIGQHNLSNILGALAVAEILRLTLSDLRRALLTYRPLSGRLQLIREKRGVRYINDTTATAPSAVIASLQALTAPLILIAGGVDKKLDLERLAKVISGRVRRLILLPGSATDKLVVFLKRLGYQDYQLADSMAAAVQMAATLARRGEVVLLSPGAASFGLFINEFDRGDKFNQAVKTL